MRKIKTTLNLYIVKAEAIASHPFFGGLTAFVTIMAGALASFFTDDIRNNLTPFVFSDSVSLKASAFWACVIMAGVFLGGGQWAQNRRASRTTRELGVMINRLQTLPADGYLPSYQSCYRVAASNAFAIIYSTNPTVAQIEATIRTVLGAILETARDFDRNAGVDYYANIMLWRPNGLGLEAKSPLHLVTFVKNDPNVAGLLELIPELSTSTANGTTPTGNVTPYDRDQNISAITLPIPNDPAPVRDSKFLLRYPILPGAPWAFIGKMFASYENISQLFQWLDNSSSTDLHTIAKIKNYFISGDGKHIRSFGSMPILLPTEDALTSEDLPLGVLNLHSTKEDLLQDNGQTLFAPLLEPFLILLSILLLKREEIKIASPTKQNQGVTA